MSLRCPHCSSVIDEVEAASGSIICPGCGEEVSSTSVVGRREETRHDNPVVAGLTWAYQEQVAPRLPTHAVPPAAPLVSPPLKLGRYRLLDELGAGAFGRVYRALDSELQRHVAIKILKAERFADQQDLDKFFDEARLMASVHHPGIVAVYDVGVDLGVNYIVTQLIRGGTLHDRLARSPISHREAAELIRQCADAIHAAHKVQLYHRDLKPKNILVDEQGRAYVGDFGLAIRRKDQSDRIGEFAGSVNFMSPEQLRGEVHCIDGRSDVWALGAIFYLMLTGKLPFQGPASKLVTEIQIRNPIPPRQLQETIPPELERISLKCLEKPIAARYSTAFDLASELGDWLAGDETRIQPSVPAVTINDDLVAELLQAPTIQMPPKSVWNRGRMGFGAAIVAFAFAAWFGREIWLNLGMANSRQRQSAPKVPSDPFQIDSYAVSGRVYPLLERSPKPVIWVRPDAVTSARVSYLEALQELSVDVPEIGVLGLGQTESESFRLRVAINNNGWNGSAGLVWGFQDVQQESGELEQHCHGVIIQGKSDAQGKRKLQLMRKRSSFRPAPPELAVPSMDHDSLASVIVGIPDVGPYELDLVVHAGRLTGVRWCGIEYPSLTDSQLAQPPELSSRGIFGVVVTATTARFSEARITLFVQKSPVTP